MDDTTPVDAPALDDLDFVDYADTYELADLDAAAWALRDLARTKALLNEMTVQRNEARRRIEEWYSDASYGATRRVIAIEEMLGRFAQAMRARGTNTVTTPWGTVKTTARQPEYAVDDGPFALAELGDDGATLTEIFARHPLLRFTIEPNRSALRKHAWAVDEPAEADHDGVIVAPARTVLVVPDGQSTRELPHVTVVPQEANVIIRPVDPAPMVPNPAPASVRRADGAEVGA